MVINEEKEQRQEKCACICARTDESKIRPAKSYHHLHAVPAGNNDLGNWPTVKVTNDRWSDASVGTFSVASICNASSTYGSER